MNFIFSKKDIIALNQQFEDGTINNEASLDFAISYAKRIANWPKALAYLTRAILLDHVFEEGNKRTAALLIKSYAECEGYEIYNDRVLRLIKEVLLKNITSIRKIEGMIQDAIK